MRGWSKKKLLNSLICQCVATVFLTEIVFKSVSIVRKTTGRHLYCNKNWDLTKAFSVSFYIYHCFHGTKSSTPDEEFLLPALELCMLGTQEAQDWYDRRGPPPVPPDPRGISSSVRQLRGWDRVHAYIQLKSKQPVQFFLFLQEWIRVPSEKLLLERNLRKVLICLFWMSTQMLNKLEQLTE